jgi:hypothetical protein
MTAFDASILDESPDEYHALPGLSASIAATLISRSPLHAWSPHPCFGGRGKVPTPAMDRGTVVHRLVLGKGKDYRALPYDDWRTNAAKEAKEQARAEGLVPILQKDMIAALEIAVAVGTNLNDRGIVLNGASEVAFTWKEESTHGPVDCRGMADHLWLTSGRLLDLKIVSNAAPMSVERSAESFGYGIQWAAYTRAIGALRPDLLGRIEFVFAFCEAEPPYAINLCKPDGIFRELGERRWLRAVESWAKCLAEDKWPGYGDEINSITAPQWALMREGDFSADL